MRFHYGFSFKPKLKWIFILLGGLMAIFSNILIVNADTTQVEFIPTITYYNQYNAAPVYYPTRYLDSVNKLYYFFTTNEAYGYDYNFTYSYGGQDLCNGGNMVLKFNTALLAYGGTYYNINVEPHYSDGTTFDSLRIVDGTYSNPTLQAILKPNKSFYFIVNESSGNHTANLVYEGIISQYWELSCEYSLEDSTTDIINNNNQNTTTIINNNNQNTQNITNSIDNLNDSITEEYDGSAGGHSFVMPEINYPSTIQGMFNLPLDLLRTIVNNSDTCTPYSIDFSSITSRWGGFNYTLTLPCLRAKLQDLLGFVYTLADYLLAFYLFYNMAMYVLQLIDALTSGADLFSYLYHGTSNNGDNSGYGHYNRTTGEVID